MHSTPRFVVPILLTALAFAMVAIRWGMIERHASPVPFHDQWIAEGVTLIEPSVYGALHPANFFEPSNDHRPVLTRVLAFAAFKATGDWDTRFQMLVNSFFYALVPMILSLVLRQFLGMRAWIAATVCLGVLFALPANYENTLWGFQSQFYLMVLLAIAYLAGTFGADSLGARWTLAQFAGALGLLTMAGGIIAPLAAAGIASFRMINRRDARTIATLAVALTLIAAGWALKVPSGSSDLSMRSQSLAVFIKALQPLLAWPMPDATLALLVQVPWMLVGARTLATRDRPRNEIVITAIGGWVVMQAAAFAYARGSILGEIPPRYFDVLIVGTAVNAACLALLASRCGLLQRIFVSLLTCAWLAVVAAGLWHNNKPARLSPIIHGNADLHQRTLFAVRDYVQTGDPVALTRDPQVAHHFHSKEVMQRLLDNPPIRASLPAEIRGGSQSACGKFVEHALRSWPLILVAAALTFVAVGGVAFARDRAGPMQ